MASILKLTCVTPTGVTSPAKQSGCNTGGTGFTNSYTGPSGVMPIGPDPISGEPLTGKRSIFLWGETTHTNYY
jgi:hypothetical protein